MNKETMLKEIAIKRQNSRWNGYKCISDYHNGIYECEYVSPYTKSANNVNSPIMVFLQDWSSDERLSKEIDISAVKFGHSPELPTNKNLKMLLKEHFELNLEDIYATNVFPFIKIEGMSQKIPDKDMIKAAIEFAIPQIEIIKPVIAICLGLPAFNAIRKASGLSKVNTIDIGINLPFKISSTEIWCQAHTGALGRNNRNKNGINRVDKDWARMAIAYKSAINL
jgi:restriction system protein